MGEAIESFGWARSDYVISTKVFSPDVNISQLLQLARSTGEAQVPMIRVFLAR